MSRCQHLELLCSLIILVPRLLFRTMKTVRQTSPLSVQCCKTVLTQALPRTERLYSPMGSLERPSKHGRWKHTERLHRLSLSVTCIATTAGSGSDGIVRASSIAQRISPLTAVYVSACVATFSAAISRVSFSVLAVPIQEQYGLTLGDMGVLQSSLLMGYVLGQVSN